MCFPASSPGQSNRGCRPKEQNARGARAWPCQNQRIAAVTFARAVQPCALPQHHPVLKSIGRMYKHSLPVTSLRRKCAILIAGDLHPTPLIATHWYSLTHGQTTAAVGVATVAVPPDCLCATGCFSWLSTMLFSSFGSQKLFVRHKHPFVGQTSGHMLPPPRVWRRQQQH